MSETRTEADRLRELAERAKETLADAQRVWARYGQTDAWDAASRVATNASNAFHDACTPDAVLALLQRERQP